MLRPLVPFHVILRPPQPFPAITLSLQRYPSVALGSDSLLLFQYTIAMETPLPGLGQQQHTQHRAVRADVTCPLSGGSTRPVPAMGGGDDAEGGGKVGGAGVRGRPREGAQQKMASVCKSQQCSVERRGFRQELDSWRYKLIHCVGFESILEGLFGPGLLEDLSLFKDCEPTGVCDWSFDENCLFCCLRREKVKEHLAGFNKSETGQENLLKQEQAKIIRLERQAEEFINAVFYKKDSPRISDPNIPLVAREIMQRMIRQFAAEYTSKNSSTQDSSQLNSTKNQSLPKSPSGQSSPPPATTQNPVLSKLLMADQDSPLDLTVKKPPSEEPCEQADGVLDLSTKKSPCSGSPHSSISPSTSNAIGNGAQKMEKNAVNPCNSTSLTLENFMVKLCTHHQKQFFVVLNSLCTEEPFTNSKSPIASPLDVNAVNVEDHMREKSINSTTVGSSTNTAAACTDMENCPRETTQNIDILKSSILLGVEETSVRELNFFNSHSTSRQEENIAKNHILHVQPTEENIQMLQSDEAGCTKKLEPLQTDFSDCCVLSDSNMTLTPVTSAQETEFINLPKCADKENAQCISPRQNIQDNDCKPKQNSVHTVVTKLGNHVNHYESFQTFSDNLVPPLHTIRSHDNIKHSMTVKRCKHTLRKSDCDNQCDVVYVNDPITTQNHFQNPKPLLYSRNTARKSTRGYLFHDECCQLSTVRTLVRSTNVEDQGNCAVHFSEALIHPDHLISKTLPFTDAVSLVHSEETCLGIVPNNVPPQHKIISDQSIFNTDKISSMVGQLNAVSDSLRTSFSLVHDEIENPSVSGPRPADKILKKKLDIMEHNSLLYDGIMHSEVQDNGSEVTHFSVSVDKDRNAILTSLAVDLKDQTVLPKKNDAKTIAANAFILQKAITDQLLVPLASDSPSIDCSVFLHANENDKMTPTSSHSFPCQEISKTLESSVAMSKAFDFSHLNSSSDSVVYDIKGKAFESSSNDCIQQNQICLDHANSFLEDRFTSPKVVDHLQEDYIEKQHSEKSSVYVEPTEEDKFKNVDTAPHSEINCLTASNNDNRIFTDDVHQLLNTCAKISETSNIHLKDPKQDVQQCHPVTSLEHKNNGNIKTFSQTKEIKEEKHSNGDQLDMLYNPLLGNNFGKIPLPSKRKRKRTFLPSDRRLRSHEKHNDSDVKKKASLLVKIFQFRSNKSPHRSVTFSTDCDSQLRLHTNSYFEERFDGENCFAQFLCSQFMEGRSSLSERMFKNNVSSMPRKVDDVTVSFDISSDQRKVYFGSKINNFIKEEPEEYSCSPSGFKNDLQFKLKKSGKQISVETMVAPVRTRSRTKRVALNIPIEHVAKPFKTSKLRHLKTENEKQPVNIDSSLHSPKEMVRPKFVDWCFEEESQERISSFNNKYSSVRNNWISLEKDVSVGPKPKNKADKLQAIWKTKKRVRKAKAMEEAQQYSPVQMLFMNSFTLSDICKWFLETTETKSLVIVKKLNTRLPEEHQLPIPPSQKYPIQDLYPHILQARRLKKHLKKFASVYPAHNHVKTQVALIKLENEDQHFETSKISVKGAGNTSCSGSKPQANKPTKGHALKKYNHFKEKVHDPSPPQCKKHKPSMAKSDLAQNNRILSSPKLNSKSPSNPLSCKPVTNEKPKPRKRPKDDQLIRPGVQTSKRKKTEIKQELLNDTDIIKNALPTKRKDHKVEIKNTVSKNRASNRQEGKAEGGKVAILKKGKAKTAMQKKSSKTKLVIRRCQTRSSKLRLVPPVLSEQGINRASQQKEFCRKLCTGPKTAKKTLLLKKKINRSQTDSSTQSSR